MRHDRDEIVWRIAASREVVDGVANVFNICPLQGPGLLATRPLFFENRAVSMRLLDAAAPRECVLLYCC